MNSATKPVELTDPSNHPVEHAGAASSRDATSAAPRPIYSSSSR